MEEIDRRPTVDSWMAADLLGVDVQTIRLMSHDGRLQKAGFKPRKGQYGRPRALFYRDDVEAESRRRANKAKRLMNKGMPTYYQLE